MAICLILLFAASKQQRRLARISWFPTLFDNSYLLFVGVPLFLNPLIFIPNDLWTHRFFASFLGLIIITTVAPILYLLGVALPPELTAPSSNMYGVDRNLTTYLTTAHGALPVPENGFNVNQYFVVTLIVLLSSYSYTRYATHIKHHPNPYSLPYLIWAGIIIILGLFLHQLFRQQLFEFFLYAKPFKPLFDTILVLLPMADGAVVLIYVIALTYQYLTANHYQNTSLPLITNCLAVFLFFGDKNQFPVGETMRYFLVNVAQRWEAKLWQTTAFQSIKTALHQSLPIIVIDIYLRLSVKLILSPNALFVKLFNLEASDS
ncbi:hypothetical protein GQS40_07560|uniref:Uncharacterized protein n=1 Tax=Leuconostoc lactis TaxID=1246 RepID=A0A6L7A712_LEULA|nr:hypothetical protein [Leuconostoc lactis]